MHGFAVPTEQIRLGRIALGRLGLVAKSAERDRRPTIEELDLIIKTADTNPRQIILLGRIIMFAVATALRQDEINRVLWEDFNPGKSTLKVRQRKHPRQKRTNDQVIPLVSDSGFDPIAIVKDR